MYWFCCSRHLTPTGFKNFLGKRPCECAVLAIKTNAFPSNGSAVMNQSPRARLDGGCHFLTGFGKIASTDMCEEVDMRKGGVILEGSFQAGEATFP